MSKSKTAEKMVMGGEPELTGPITRIEMMNALNWYNYFYTIKDTKDWVEKYLSNRFSKDVTRKILRSNDLTQTHASLCRMVERGAELDCDLDRKLLELATTKMVNEPHVYKTIQIIADLDEILDTFIGNNYRKSSPQISTEYKITEKLAGKQHLENLLGELYLIGRDEQITEAYDHLSKTNLKNYITFVETLISQLIVEKKPPRTRKTKPKSPLLLTKNVKYMQDCKELKAKSFPPVHIIGAKEVWIYNTKDRKLSRLVSNTGLTVKGTTIGNIDSSEVKTIRKPGEIIPFMLNNGKVAIRKKLESIKAKSMTSNGRLNEYTILLRYF